MIDAKILTLFLFSLGLSMLPLLFKRMEKLRRFFPHAIVMSAGFMLCFIFTDMIPHMMESAPYHHHGKHSSHVIDDMVVFNGFFYAGLSFIALISIDTLILHHSHCDNEDIVHNENHKNKTSGKHSKSCTDIIKYSTSKAQAFFFMIAISVHSFLEGFAIQTHSKAGLDLCIFVHKLIESMSLGLTVFSSGFSTQFAIFLMTVYSSLTPLGMICLNTFNPTKHVEGILNGLALGSIMFIVFVETIPAVFHDSKFKKLNVVLLIVGYFIPILLLK